MTESKKFGFLTKVLQIQNAIIPREKFLRIFYFLSMIALGIYLQNWWFTGFAVLASLYCSLKGQYPAKDKLEHYYMGVIYFLVIGVPIVYFLKTGEFYYALPAIIGGALKEIADLFGFGNPDEKDFIKTIQFPILFILLN